MYDPAAERVVNKTINDLLVEGRALCVPAWTHNALQLTAADELGIKLETEPVFIRRGKGHYLTRARDAEGKRLMNVYRVDEAGRRKVVAGVNPITKI